MLDLAHLGRMPTAEDSKRPPGQPSVFADLTETDGESLPRLLGA